MEVKENKLYNLELKSKAEKLEGEEKQLGLNIFYAISSKSDEINKYINAISYTLQTMETKTVNTDSEVHKFFYPAVEIVNKLSGSYAAEIFSYIIEHHTEYPYSTGYMRRPFRTMDKSCHIYRVIYALLDLINLYRYKFSILDYLTVGDYPLKYNIINFIIAYEIDNKNQEVINALKNIIYGDNNTALLSRIMINGIFFSHDTDVWKFMGELLNAARLQEGLRQSIVESMDEGNCEAYKYMMKIIIDNNFIRYSSVVRAIGVWTGIPFEAEKSRTPEQCINYMYECLDDEKLCNEWLHSDNTLKLYVCLWCTAVKEEKDLYEKIDYIMESGDTYQKIAAQYFLTQSQNDRLRFSISEKYLEQEQQELQYFIISNYVYKYEFRYDLEKDGKLHEHLYYYIAPDLKNKDERRRQFNIFKNMLIKAPKKENIFHSRGFEWLVISYSSDIIVEKMLYLTCYDMSHEYIDEIIELKDMINADKKCILIDNFIKDHPDTIQRDFLFECLSDASLRCRRRALLKIKKIDITSDEIKKVENILMLKSGELRQRAIEVLLSVNNDMLQGVLDRLLKSKNEMQRLGALEVLCELKNNKDSFAQYSLLKDKISYIESPTEKEKVLISKLDVAEKSSIENGFGLFDPSSQVILKYLKGYDGYNIKDFFTLSEEIVKHFLTGLSELIHKYREYEYECRWDNINKEKFLVGAYLHKLNYSNREDNGTNAYPLAEIWREYFRNSGLSAEKLIQIVFYINEDNLYRHYFDKLSPWEKSRNQSDPEEEKALIREIYPINEIEDIYKFKEQLLYIGQIKTLLFAFMNDCGEKNVFTIISRLSGRIICLLSEKGKEPDLLIGQWMNWEREYICDDDCFKEYFCQHYKMYALHEYKSYNPSLEEFIRAYSLSIIDKDELIREIMTRKASPYHIRDITKNKSDLIKKYPFMKELRDNIVKRILDIELSRGDLPTEATGLAGGIEYYEGMEYFVKILSGLNKDTFTRGYIYMCDKDSTRKDSFSHLLKVCYPGDGEDERLLNEMLKGRDISEKRLLEAAMYAPQWIGITAKYLNWEGLESAAWYFHAHVNETFSSEKETMVARYSPISPREFQDGAFDINWFMEAYNTLGEKRFSDLYDCAKYISGGSNHRRSQLFADAVLGRLDLQETKQSAEIKRNKDHLLCYTLIPIEKDNNQDIYERYEFLHQFLKESKKFGAMRRSSEARTADIAFDNLARNAGYKDTLRLTWDMEAKKSEKMTDYLKPHNIDNIAVQLSINEEGLGDIKVWKDNKELKSIPSKYSKQEYILKLKEIKSSIKEQHVRAKTELENSMTEENAFSLDEMNNLIKNPVIAPLIKTLVLKVGKHLGYFSKGTLYELNGESYPIKSADEIFIAHPVHLYESGRWSEYQKDIFEKKIKQPFKQVFRELYIPNKDELDSGTISRRYAGYQVQPRKTAALLKSRLWTVNYEEGLQKVFYKQNIIAQVFAMADWFSPADTESPTLECIRFFNRNTYKVLEIKNIPTIIFSEIMRDLDFVVSAAYVGGVDPEASLSTIEMRKAIIRESLTLMKIGNVKLQGNFAIISGKLGEYSVHLGSAVSFKHASGALNILPVHSQHRGRIFLPFMDEDPRTSEILSKIIMLAQDTKIKDPLILEQIRK